MCIKLISCLDLLKFRIKIYIVLLNIKYLKEQVSLKEIENYAKLVNFHQNVLTFENGYRTIIGEHGLRLSAEEKFKLLAIRSLIRNPKFVIIDEVNLLIYVKVKTG
jgi:ABC-type multidrug transport system fused ATPase/permease subunit